MLEDISEMSSVKTIIENGKKITSFIYNSDKVVNLMKQHTKDRDLLRPGITRFATVFIALESLVRHSIELKRMCTTHEWVEFNNTSRRRDEAVRVSELILADSFWKKVREVCAVLEPLVRVLKIVDQDKKPTLSVIYEAMDRVKMAIKGTVKSYKKYWDVIDERWYKQLHNDLHAAGNFINNLYFFIIA